MIRGKIKIRQAASQLCLILFLTVAITACKKEDSTLPEAEDADASLFYKLIRVENLAGDTTNEDQPTKIKQDFYFSFEHNKRRDAAYRTTSQWDMAFTGIKNAGISANNGTDKDNFGFGNQARGGIAIVEKDFNEVTEVPKDLKFITSKAGIFLDAAGVFGEGIGWALYDFGGGIAGDGTPEKQHVCYALGYPLTLRDGSIVPARTLIIQTANGNTVKVRMISMYKDIFTPEKSFKQSPAPYFTFEYVMIPKGENTFKIK